MERLPGVFRGRNVIFYATTQMFKTTIQETRIEKFRNHLKSLFEQLQIKIKA